MIFMVGSAHPTDTSVLEHRRGRLCSMFHKGFNLGQNEPWLRGYSSSSPSPSSWGLRWSGMMAMLMTSGFRKLHLIPIS